MSRKLVVVSSACALALALVLVGCARARPALPTHAGAAVAHKHGAEAPPGADKERPAAPKLATADLVQKPLAPPAVPTSAPKVSKAQRLAARRAALRRLVAAELADPLLAKLRVSVVAVELTSPRPPTTVPAPTSAQTPTSTAAPLGGDVAADPLVSVAADARRVPASNAKLLTSVAALRLLAGHRFKTQVLRRGSRVYLRGGGDPLLSGKDLMRLARQARAKGVSRVTHVYVDDSYFSRKQLAPGFEKFLAGSPYRPTCGGLNVGANAITIKVSAAKGRRRPRVDVYPPSDYVKVRKRVRFLRARGGKAARRRNISINMSPKGSILWLTISGTMGRKAKTFIRRRAVYDPALNAGWAFRRALKKVGVRVKGIVTRGRAPRKGRVLVQKARSLASVLRATNKASHNLAAETLIRAMGRGRASGAKRRSEWPAGLARASAALKALGMRHFALKNGSGLHRSTTVTAADMVRLLAAVWRRPRLRRWLLPTLAVAGRSGTLARRMRGTPARGVIMGKTGTLGSVLALSGYALSSGAEAGRPLAFSILVNGSARRRVRRRMDRIAVLLARYALGERLSAGEEPATAPAAGQRLQPRRVAAADLGKSKTGKAAKKTLVLSKTSVASSVPAPERVGLRIAPIPPLPIPPMPTLPEKR